MLKEKESLQNFTIVFVFLNLLWVNLSCSKKPSLVANMKAESSPTIVFLGDSLTAGYGLPAEQAFPALIQKKIEAARLNFVVMNGGVSGDTTADGLARLAFYLRPELNVRHFVIALGTNDAMRGIALSQIQENLRSIIRRVKEKGIPFIYLVEIKTFKNMYSPYGNELAVLYHQLAKQEQVILVPFFLAGVADVAHLNMPDGIHPTKEGMILVAENVWRTLEPYLRADSK